MFFDDANSVIKDLNDSVRGFENSVKDPVNNVYTSSQNVNINTNKILANIQSFESKMVKGEESQLARENIIRIDQILKEQFSDHDAIRKTVMGIVRDFDVNLVRNSSIDEISEELWITSSRYWLSYALIALSAWVNNYPEIAKNALSEAARRDPIKTGLMFCITNLRFGRIEPAKRWFCEYLKILDPNNLQNETAVLILAFLNGLFGKDKEMEYEILDLMENWIQVVRSDGNACEKLINDYKSFVVKMKSPVKYNYSYINQFCTNNDAIRHSFYEVAKYESLLDLMEELDEELGEQTEENYKERVDAVLYDLISKYDAEELKLKNQQAYFKFIVDNKGDKTKAKEQYEHMVHLQAQGFNIGAKMVEWVTYEDNDSIDVKVRKFALQNTRELFSEAVKRWDMDLQAAKPVNYVLAIDTWKGVSTGDDSQKQLKDMRNYYESNKFHNIFINTVNIALTLLIIVSLALVSVSIYSLVATVVGTVVLAYFIYKGIKDYKIRVENAINNLNETMTEIAAFKNFYEEKRMLKEELMSFIEYI